VLRSSAMDAQQALADLTEISSQIEAAVLLGPRGGVTASTVADTDRARELAHKAAELLAAADGIKAGTDEALTQLEVATTEGSVFVVREGDKRIAATTAPQPTVGLVFYDLKSCLRSLDDAQEQNPTRARTHADAP
jgi:predicted regulator of Ras-like GTPase activity (Roadblock/LC7/MglB family)